MILSSHDMLALVGELMTRRVAMVGGKAAKKRGIPFQVLLNTAPERVQQGLKAMRVLHERYRKGDYRHTSVEAGNLAQLCNWLHELNGSLRIPEIDPLALETTIPCEAGIYPSLIQAVRQQL